MSQSTRDEALRLLAEPLDLTGAVVDTEPSTAKIVHSVRLDPEQSERLFAEAARRGLTPSALLRDIVEQALAPAPDAEATVTVRLADLHRALDSAIRQAA
jgi:predicted DNA-binding protein